MRKSKELRDVTEIREEWKEMIRGNLIIRTDKRKCRCRKAIHEVPIKTYVVIGN